MIMGPRILAQELLGAELVSRRFATVINAASIVMMAVFLGLALLTFVVL
jgi:hypothetical protein